MTAIYVKSESVYECDVCKRRTRIPANKRGIEVINRCIITANCAGELHRVTDQRIINDTPAFPPEISGVTDWSQRQTLFTHTQTVAAATWTIKHNLGTKPNVYAYKLISTDASTTNDDTLERITPASISTVDLNTTVLTFSAAVQGVAQCVSPASRVTTTATAGVTQTASDIVLAQNCELTIATLSSLTHINVSLTYDSPASTSLVPVEYYNVGAPSTDSAWAGAETVIINGKKYTVRSFNIRTTDSGAYYFDAGTLTSGSTFYFTDITTPGNTLILMANSPYGSVDRTYNKYIDASTISTSQPELYYNDGAVYASQSVVKSTYPPIIVV